MKSYFACSYPNVYVTALAIAALFIFSWGIDDWRYGIVGDEAEYFHVAVGISRSLPFYNPFNLEGVYRLERALGSYWQALWLRAWGENIIAWRLANIALIAPITLLFFSLLNRLLGERIAYLGSTLLACSYYLINFFKIGYTHPLCLLLFLLVFRSTVIAIEHGEAKDFSVLGLALGLSFYAYVGPIFPLIFLPPLLLMRRKTYKKDFLKYSLFFMSYGLLVAIGYATSAHYSWSDASRKTVFNAEFDGWSQVLCNIAANFALFFKDFDYFYNHFVYGGYLDFISQFFAVAGIVSALYRCKIRGFALLLACWSLTAVVLGIINPYPYVPATRGILFIPFGAAFAAIGIEGVCARIIPQLRWRNAAIAVLLIVMACVNMHRAHHLVFEQVGHTDSTLVLRKVREAASRFESPVYLFLSPTSAPLLNVEMIRVFLIAHGLTPAALKVISSPSGLCLAPPSHVIVLAKDPELSALYENYCVSKHGIRIEVLHGMSPRTVPGHRGARNQ